MSFYRLHSFLFLLLSLALGAVSSWVEEDQILPGGDQLPSIQSIEDLKGNELFSEEEFPPRTTPLIDYQYFLEVILGIQSVEDAIKLCLINTFMIILNCVVTYKVLSRIYSRRQAQKRAEEVKEETEEEKREREQEKVEEETEEVNKEEEQQTETVLRQRRLSSAKTGEIRQEN